MHEGRDTWRGWWSRADGQRRQVGSGGGGEGGMPGGRRQGGSEASGAGGVQRTVVEGQRPVSLEGLDEAVEQARVDPGGSACRRARGGASRLAAGGLQRASWTAGWTRPGAHSVAQHAEALEQRTSQRIQHTQRSAHSCSMHITVCKSQAVPNTCWQYGAQRTHHARLDHVDRRADADSEESGAQPRRQVAVHIVLEHACGVAGG
jgi:hypothetical protein